MFVRCGSVPRSREGVIASHFFLMQIAGSTSRAEDEIKSCAMICSLVAASTGDLEIGCCVGRGIREDFLSEGSDWSEFDNSEGGNSNVLGSESLRLILAVGRF